MKGSGESFIDAGAQQLVAAEADADIIDEKKVETVPDEFIPGPCRVSLKQVILLDELIAFTDTDAVVCTSVDVVLHEVGIADTILEADGGVLDASFFVCGTDTNTILEKEGGIIACTNSDKEENANEDYSDSAAKVVEKEEKEDVALCALHDVSLVATTDLMSDLVAIGLDDDSLLSAGGDEGDASSGCVHDDSVGVSILLDVPVAVTNLDILPVLVDVSGPSLGWTPPLAAKTNSEKICKAGRSCARNAS